LTTFPSLSFHTYGNATQTSIKFGMGNLYRKELSECNVQLVRMASAIGLHEAEIKMPKFFTNIP